MPSRGSGYARKSCCAAGVAQQACMALLVDHVSGVGVSIGESFAKLMLGSGHGCECLPGGFRVGLCTKHTRHLFADLIT